MKEIELTEYRQQPVAQGRLVAQDVAELLDHHSHRIDLQLPSVRNGRRYMLTSQGWAGYLPLPSGLGLRLRPKVPIGNLFRMLEYAYRLKSFEFLQGLYPVDSLDDIYERLASVLAKRVLERARRGLAREYVDRREDLAALRGRLDMAMHLVAPWRVRLGCHYQDHTANIIDNQLLAWTLRVIARSGRCQRQDVRRLVRRAYHSMAAAAHPIPASPTALADRLYHRLNEDYRPLHALCRFFLDDAGPSHRTGERQSLPFLLDMPILFELFVAEWLAAHLPSSLEVVAQRRVPLGDQTEFRVDLVLHERSTGQALAVLDTKYKVPDSPAPADVAQVVAYAEAIGCQQAVLVYPRALVRGQVLRVGKIEVRSLVFELEGDIEINGRELVRELIGDSVSARDDPPAVPDQERPRY